MLKEECWRGCCRDSVGGSVGEECWRGIGVGWVVLYRQSQVTQVLGNTH